MITHISIIFILLYKLVITHMGQIFTPYKHVSNIFIGVPTCLYHSVPPDNITEYKFIKNNNIKACLYNKLG